MSRHLKGAARSKLCWLGMAVSVAGFLQVNQNIFQAYLTPGAQGFVTLGLGVTVIVLRFLTDKPLDEK